MGTTPATLIIDEDFANPTYTWTSSHSDIGVSNGKLEFTNLVNTVPTSGTNKRISLDLGTPLDQNDWVIRFLYTPTSQPNDSAVMFYMSDEPPTSTANQDQDAIGMTHYMAGGTGYWQSQVGVTDDGNPMSSLNNNLSPNFVTTQSTQYGLQIQRIGGSTVELEVYDNTWTTLHTSYTISNAASTVDGLQYFKVGNIMSGAGAASRSGNIDDLQICSGESDIANCSASPTSNPTTILSFDNSAGEQGKIEVEPTKLRFKLETSPTITYSDDMTTDVWDQHISASDSSTQVTGGKFEYDQGENQVNVRMHAYKADIDNVSDSAWIMRYIHDIDTLSATANPDGAGITLGLYDSHTVTGGANGMWNGDFMGMRTTIGFQSGFEPEWMCVNADNGDNAFADWRGSATMSTTPSAGVYGIELIRDGNDFTCKIYDSSFSSVTETHTVTDSNVDGLDHLVVVMNDANDSGTTEHTGTYDDILFCNGETSWANCSAGSTSIDIEKTGLTIPGDSLSHIALTKNSNDYTFYLNGTSVHTATDTDSLGTISNNKFWIGTQTDGTTNPASQLDEFFINSVAESSTTIDNIFDRGANRFTNIHTMGNTNTSHNDSSVSAGTDYTYATKAYNGNFYSGYSNFAYGTAGTPPDPPTNLGTQIQDTNAAPLTVRVTWTTPSNVGSGTLSGFEIYRDNVLITTTGLVNLYDDTVPNAGTFVYKAKAVSNHGTSTDSNTSSITTPNAPGIPQTLTASIPDIDAAPFNVQLDWTAPASDGGSAITGYKLYRDTVLQATLGNILTTTNTTPSNANTAFNFTVSAINNVGESVGKSTTWTSPSAPASPTNLAGTFVAPGINLSWTNPSSDSAITGYQIFRDGGAIALIGNTTSYSDSNNISSDAAYQYYTKAISNVGTGSASNTITVNTLNGNVADLTSSNISGETATLSWTAPPFHAGNVVGYQINFTSPFGTPNQILVNNTGDANTVYYLSNLNFNSNYTMRVGVYTPSLANFTGNLHNFTTLEDTSLTSFNVTQGFDIEATNPAELQQIKFLRTDNTDGTTTFDIIHPITYDLNCNLDNKFSMTNANYTGAGLPTTVISSDDKKATFTFTSLSNDVITVKCTDTVTKDSNIQILTQTNFPLLQQLQTFQAGGFGTDGMFGGLDVVTLIVVLGSMIGFNRISPVVGIIVSSVFLFVMSYFSVVAIPTAVFGAIIVAVVLAIVTTRKK